MSSQSRAVGAGAARLRCRVSPWPAIGPGDACGRRKTQVWRPMPASRGARRTHRSAGSTFGRRGMPAGTPARGCCSGDGGWCSPDRRGCGTDGSRVRRSPGGAPCPNSGVHSTAHNTQCCDDGRTRLARGRLRSAPAGPLAARGRLRTVGRGRGLFSGRPDLCDVWAASEVAGRRGVLSRRMGIEQRAAVPRAPCRGGGPIGRCRR